MTERDFLEYTARAKATGLNIYAIAAMDSDGHSYRAQITPANPTNDVYSVAKAYAVTGVGLAYDAGLLSPDANVPELLGDEMPSDADKGWRDVTLDQLMRHRAGYGRGWLDIDVDDASEYPADDYLSLAMREPLVHAPGEVYQYTDAAFYITSRIVEHAVNKPLDDYLRPMLMGKLKYREMGWSRCPKGHAMGATGLFLRVEDMTKLGMVYAQGGKWQAERLLSEKWVTMCLERGYEFGKIADDWYGKGGMFGQMLCFNVEKQCALAWQAHTETSALNAILGIRT